MATDRILALMALMNDIKRPHATYWRAVLRATETYTDSPENNAAQTRGNAALLEIEQAIRQWVAEHPENKQPPSDNHAAIYVDGDGDPWVEYLTSPRSDHVVGLQLASEEAVDRREVEDRIGKLALIGWCRQA